MNQNKSQLLSMFIAQRMEMGEKEWYCGPEKDIIAQFSDKQSSGAAAAFSAPAPSVEPFMPKKTGTPSCSQNDVTDDLISAQKSLVDLNDAVCNCQRCALGASRTKFVFGDGNPRAGIMFIGEAPGADEDLQGLPFVGRGGKLLTKMIEAMKLDRKDVYIGNILKCRPPNNRDPKSDEIESCEPILLRQIELIKPKIICALGRISGQTILRTKATLGSLRGVIHDYHGVKFVVTYHPAALLRNPNWKKPAWDDLKMVRREFDGMEL